MKKLTTIILSAVFGMGIALSSSVFASESGIAMPSMKDIAKTTAKQVAEQKMDEAHQAASNKLTEIVDGKTANATKAVNATEEKAEKVKDEMHEMHHGK